MPPKGFSSITVSDYLKEQLGLLARMKGYSSVASFLRAKLEVLRYA